MKFILLGLLATAFMDIWAALMKVFFSISGLDYRFLGRWIGGFSRGEFTHCNITQSKPFPNELLIGYIAHYSIGVFFALVLVYWKGKSWVEVPTVQPALIVSTVSLVAPLFVMQPAFGFGVASIKIKPTYKLWCKSFMAHTSYGIGLYLSALMIKTLIS